jgi:hypothetical protein
MIDRQVVLHALSMLESLRVQLEDGLEGGGAVVAPYCLNEKLRLLTQDVQLMGRAVDVVSPRLKGDAR